MTNPTPVNNFKDLDPARRRELASQGGKAAQASGKAHLWTQEQAIEAGRKGGKATSANRAHMAMIGARGGKATKVRRAPEAPTP